MYGAGKDYLAASSLDIYVLRIELRGPFERLFDPGLDVCGRCYRGHDFDRIGDALYASYVTDLTLGRRFLVVVVNRTFQRDPAIRHDHLQPVGRDSAIELECRPRGFCYLSVGSLIVQLDPDDVGQGCDTGDVFRYALRGPFFSVAGYVPRESDDAVFNRDRYFASVDAGLPFKRPLDVTPQFNVSLHKRVLFNTHTGSAYSMPESVTR